MQRAAFGSTKWKCPCLHMSSPSSSLATWILHVLGRQTFLHSHPEVFSKGYHQHCARTSWVIRSYLFAAATSKEPNLQYLTITNPKHEHTATPQLPLRISEYCMHTLYLSFSVGAYFQVDSCQCLQSLFVACQFWFDYRLGSPISLHFELPGVKRTIQKYQRHPHLLRYLKPFRT